MKRDNYGFSALVVVFLIVVLAIVGFVGYKVLSNKDGGNEQSKASESSTASSQKDTEEPDIALQNVGLQSLDSVLVSQDAVRDFKSQGLKGFYVFGDKLSGGRTNPNFEFASLKENTEVISAIDGVVGFVKEQTDSGDVEVIIQPKENSKWSLGYDHLTNVKLKQGDVVKVGDVIGKPAVQGNGLLRFEFQVNKDENNTTTHVCPSTLLAASVKDKVLADLSAMQTKWESTTGLELYEVSAQDPVGCLVKTLTPAQAEGS